MPTVLFINGFRFFFYSNENNEPVHIHVTKGGAEGKIWLEPAIAVAYMFGFTNTEQNEMMKIVSDNQQQFKNKWHEYFGK
jgi:hypothetical protein